MFQDYKVAYLRDHVRVKRATRLSALRQGLAYLMTIAAREIPHAAMTIELDMTPLIEFCKVRESELANRPDRGSPEIILKRAVCKVHSAFFMKAFAHSLDHTPCMNGFLEYAPWRYGGTLYEAEDVNIAFTVHTKQGVLRPIMRNAHQKTIETVAQEMRELSRKARKTDAEQLYREAGQAYLWPAIKQLDWRAILPGYLLLRDRLFPVKRPDPEYAKIPRKERLSADDILGATCSIANIGMMVPGHQTVTVLTPPEVMMFGLGHIRPEPRVVDGDVVVRHVVTLCFTMDHRAYDAGDAFPFGDYLFKYLKNPALIYDWKPGDDI